VHTVRGNRACSKQIYTFMCKRLNKFGIEDQLVTVLITVKIAGLVKIIYLMLKNGKVFF